MANKALNQLISIIGTLRSEEGCPWDRAQDFTSMRPYLLEEAYETLEAMDNKDPNALHEELGDLLFVVLMLIQMGAEQRFFSLDSVCQRIVDKMIFRHPNVFSDTNKQGKVEDSLTLWENQKAKNNPRRSRLDGVPKTLPALLRSHRQGEKAAAVGFDWNNADEVMHKVDEELIELKDAIKTSNATSIQHELGDVLMALCSLGRHLSTPAESALREGNERFYTRFAEMERIAALDHTHLGDLNTAQKEALWEQAKRRHKQ